MLGQNQPAWNLNPYPSPALTTTSSTSSIPFSINGTLPGLADNTPYKSSIPITPVYLTQQHPHQYTTAESIQETLRRHEAALQHMGDTLSALVRSTDQRLNEILHVLTSTMNQEGETPVKTVTKMVKDWKSEIIPPTLSGPLIIPNPVVTQDGSIGMERAISDHSLLSNFSQLGSVYHEALTVSAQEIQAGLPVVEGEESWNDIAERTGERVMAAQSIGIWGEINNGPHASSSENDADGDTVSLCSGVETLPPNYSREPTPVLPSFLTPAPALFSSRSTRANSSLRAGLMIPTPPRIVATHSKTIRDVDEYTRTASRKRPLTPSQSPNTPQNRTSLGPSRTLRQRSNQPDYVRHPMDSHNRWKKRDKSLTVSEGIPENVRGRSAIPEHVVLQPGDGSKSAIGGMWPKKKINSVRCRMEEVVCDSCGGRAHWACAGFNEKSQPRRNTWSCPDCTIVYNSGMSPMPKIERTQQDRCLRPDCVHRSYQKVKHKKDDKDQFFITEIIGRRAISRLTSGNRVFEYLVKWDQWEIYDSTWEPASNIPDLEHYEDHFKAECKKLKLDIHRKLAMLPETVDWFDDNGDLKKDKLIEKGVEPKAWWY